MVSSINEMKLQAQRGNDGNILLCALCTIVIISLIGANVLINCTTRYNVTAKQLKGWKEALYAAEAGGDAGFDEVRKALDPINLPLLPTAGRRRLPPLRLRGLLGPKPSVASGREVTCQQR
jgi:hypothetical protein